MEADTDNGVKYDNDASRPFDCVLSPFIECDCCDKYSDRSNDRGDHRCIAPEIAVLTYFY